jgi:hypothetical protein
VTIDEAGVVTAMHKCFGCAELHRDHGTSILPPLRGFGSFFITYRGLTPPGYIMSPLRG